MLRLLLLYHCPVLCRQLDTFELRPDLYATRSICLYAIEKKLCFVSDARFECSWLVTMMAADLEMGILLRLWDGNQQRTIRRAVPTCSRHSLRPARGEMASCASRHQQGGGGEVLMSSLGGVL